MRSLAAVLFTALALIGAQDPPKKPAFKSFLGKAPPAIEAAKDRWLNADEPLSLEKLKGKVVFLEFIGSVT